MHTYYNACCRDSSHWTITVLYRALKKCHNSVSVTFWESMPHTQTSSPYLLQALCAIQSILHSFSSASVMLSVAAAVHCAAETCCTNASFVLIVLMVWPCVFVSLVHVHSELERVVAVPAQRTLSADEHLDLPSPAWQMASNADGYHSLYGHRPRPQITEGFRAHFRKR